MKVFKYGDIDEYDTKTQNIINKYNNVLKKKYQKVI